MSDLQSRVAAVLLRTLRAVGRTDGNVVIVFALTLPLIIGGAALGVETSYWYYKDLELQAAADAAAFAGAVERRAGSTVADVTAEATASAVSNTFRTDIGTIVVNTPPASGANVTAQAVEVILTQPVQRYFSQIFLKNDIVQQARAVARYLDAGNACLLSLDPSVKQAVLFSGNTTVTLVGCNVMANSIASDAIKSQGSARAHVDCFISGGGVSLTRDTTWTCPKNHLHMPPVGDPFADLPVPTNFELSQTSGSKDYTPGKFVYPNGLTLKGTIALQPGTYIIGGSGLSVNANANVSGTGVTFYLEGSARVSMNGNATVNLAAPTTGTYSGILFYGDRNNTGTSTNKFNGTASSLLTGIIYFKSQAVEYLGNFSGINGCTRIVAKTIAWTGNSTINQDCSALGLADVKTSQPVQLVE